MTINDVSNVFGFLGGLGMFLYGMNIMADGMQKTAGSKMSQFLSMLTNNRLMAVCLGALITPTAWVKFKTPALTKPTTMTVVAPLL